MNTHQQDGSSSLAEREFARLQALREYDILDTANEKSYDDVTFLASTLCGTPVSIITLLDEKRQWFKSAHGVMLQETPRELAFCNHTITGKVPLIVPDLQNDRRFATNPLVLGDPFVRFYAGAPLITPNGFTLGSVCVVDVRPRTLSDAQIHGLEALADQVVSQLEIRRVAKILANEMRKVKTLEGLLPVCSFCKGVRDDKGTWSRIEDYIMTHADVQVTHGLCNDCAKTHYPEISDKLFAADSAPECKLN